MTKEARFNLVVTRISEYSDGWDEEVTALISFLKDPRIYGRLLVAPASTGHRFHHANEGGLLDHIGDMLKFFSDMARSKLFLIEAEPVEGYHIFHGRKAVLHSLNSNGETALWSAIRSVDAVLAIVLHDIHKLGDAGGRPRFIPNILQKGKRSDALPWKTNDDVNACHEQIPLDYKNAELVQARVLLERNRDDFPDGEYSLALVAALAPSLYDLLNDDVKFAIRHHDGAYGRARRNLTGNETPLMLVLHFLDMWSSRQNHASYKSTT